MCCGAAGPRHKPKGQVSMGRELPGGVRDPGPSVAVRVKKYCRGLLSLPKSKLCMGIWKLFWRGAENGKLIFQRK